MTGPSAEAHAAGASSGRRLRGYLLLGIALSAALALLTTTRQWWTLSVDSVSVPVVGSTASPAIAALSVCSFALIGALAIAGPAFRIILGTIQTLTGITTVVAAWFSLATPVESSAEPLSTATGLTGSQTLLAAVTDVNLTAWGFVAVGAGVASALVGILVAVSGRRWPNATARYSAVRLQSAEPDAIADWDSLSRGDDPSTRG